MSLSWKSLLGRAVAVSAVASASIALGVVVGVRVARADPGGPTRGDLTFAGVLPERAGRADTRLTFVFRRGVSTTAACTVTTLAFEPGPGGAFAVAVPLDGCADARGLFDGENVVYDVRLGDVSGPIIAPNVAVTPVPYARFADQAGVNNDCPAGYARDPALGGELRLCRRGNDEVVRVGRGAGAFWIDRHEATVWSMPDGNGTTYNSDAEIDLSTVGLARNGEWTDPPPARLYAASVSGRLPARWVTWFQAAELCRASGKRLPTGEEWITAAHGTPDPATNELGDGRERRCLTRVGGPGRTGERVPLVGTIGCQSRWGALDMIGNVWEWTGEWYAGNGATGPVNGGLQNWPAEYNMDATWNVNGAVDTGGALSLGIPSAALRGGYWNDGPQAGVFALFLNAGPSTRGPSIGFRCVVPG